MGKKCFHIFKVYLIVTMKIPHHTNLISAPEEQRDTEENFSHILLGRIFLIG